MTAQDTSITGLPVELLELVFAYLLDPLDFCNASSTCKQLRTASERLMKDHQALAFRYATLNFPDSEDDSATVWTVLSEVLKDPRIRYHVREVNFEASRQLFFDENVGSSWDIDPSSILPPAELLETFAAADGADEILSDGMDLVQWWPNARTPKLDFEHGVDDPIISLLIRQMPNLHALKYAGKGEGANFGRFLWHTAHVFRSLTPPSFLSKLESVSLEHWDTEGGMNLSWVLHFLHLPSVKTIRGHMINADEDWEPILMEPILSTSNVSTLVFTYSCIELNALDRLLSATQSLKFFSYEHAGGIVGYAEYEPRGVVAVLLKHAGHSLEVLKISNGDDQEVRSTMAFASLSVNKSALCFKYRPFYL
jgi:hypothetical protein